MKGTKTKPTLPVASRSDRWQPIRCGLLNIYRFDDEVFIFENGRLLLRGNNGTGKSRILALTLPFLLEGEVASHRVEPDGDPAKRMEWNLLMGRHSDRLGYTWIEFGRKRSDGSIEYVTLGCGLKAAQGRGLVGHWFFVTPQRVGETLFLAENRTTHSKSRLEQEIGTMGKVFTKASDYREAVDKKLFGLGSQYEALLNLLVQLRQPQLSRKFDESLVSNALSDALPPASEKLLGEVAEAFRNLQTEEDALANVRAALTGVETFLREYRRYVQIAARRRATRVIATHKEHNGVVRRQKQYESEKQTVEKSLAELQTDIGKLIADETELAAKHEALRDSPEMRSAEQLTAAANAADEAAQLVETSKNELSTAESRGTRATQELAKQQTDFDLALAESHRKIGSALNDARAAAIERDYETATALLKLDTLEDVSLIKTAEQCLDAVTQRHLTNVEHLEKLETAVGDAHSALKQAQQGQSEVENQLTAAKEEQTRKHQELETTKDTLLKAYRNWFFSLKELQPTDPERFEELFSTWVEVGNETSPLNNIVHEALRKAQADIAKSSADAKHRADELAGTLLQLETERKQLLEGAHRPPNPPTTRDPLSRIARPGAPFWALCDFRAEISLTERAGVEAALEAAGLLDAWVTPDGRLLNPEDLDSVIVAGVKSDVAVDKTLAQALQPDSDGVVQKETIAAILGQIGYGEGSGYTWVNADGEWQIGPLRGRWRKQAAQHIGASARETERQRQISEIGIRIQGVEAAKAVIDAEIETLKQRDRAAETEVSTAPTDAAVRQAIANRNSATTQVNLLHKRVQAAEKLVRERRNTWHEAVQKRDVDARDLSLSEWVGKLAQLKNNLHQFRTTIASLWPLLHNLVLSRVQANASQLRVAEARIETEAKGRAHEAARKKHLTLKTRYETLQNSVGSTVKQLHDNIAEVTKQLDEARKRKQDKDKILIDETKKLGAAESSLAQITPELNRTDQERTSAINALAAFTAVRLLAIAHDNFRNLEMREWLVKEAVELSRQVDELLDRVNSSDDDWKRHQDAIYGHIEDLKRTLLQCEFTPEPTATEDGLFLVNVPFQGRACTMVELHEALASDIATRQTLLDAREREVIEKYLLDEAASELHIRLREGEEWVRRANEELVARPMGTGMTLRFEWQVRDDGPPGLLAARKQLLRLSSTWSPAERNALGSFLQEQIALARQNNAGSGWQQHLAEALDYRRWHRFAILQKRDGEWKRLTKRTHGTGSGGEKAVALTLPQFAAAAAHYRSVPEAPRLILLDEAFVGVDSDMRRKCMDLLTTFDLDLVMTSEREWGCYPTVPALAIYQLARRDTIDAIGITRWVWNGKQRVSDSSSVVTACAPALDVAAPTELKLNEI